MTHLGWLLQMSVDKPYYAYLLTYCAYLLTNFGSSVPPFCSRTPHGRDSNGTELGQSWDREPGNRPVNAAAAQPQLIACRVASTVLLR